MWVLSLFVFLLQKKRGFFILEKKTIKNFAVFLETEAINVSGSVII